MEEVLSTEGNKMVIFSQWERMTRLVAEELDQRGIKYAYLHGGVPSAKRGDLLTSFNDDDECKVFLSTDAGGTGLNLQKAAYMVNLDIPWNPAVLEQRISRVYRMGQEHGVSIINLVSSNTIEHRMLDILRFKTSMFKGVLDQGDDAIFMSESRFNKFMQSVDQMTDAQGEEGETKSPVDTISEEEEQDSTEAPQGAGKEKQAGPQHPEKEEGEKTGKSPNGQESQQANAPQEPIHLVQQGVQFFSKLGETLKDPEATQELVTSITQKDEETGQTYLKIPVEDQQSVSNALQLLGSLVGNLKD